MIRPFVLHPAAAADLREIARYSRQQWGEERARAYTGKLRQRLLELAQGSGFSKDLSDIHPNLRCVLCGHHYLFFLPRPNAPLLVVALLHERMDSRLDSISSAARRSS